MKIKHQNVNLLFFINAVLGTVLDSLTGSFEKNAKYKFSKALTGVNNLEKELLRSCDLPAQETYNKSALAVATILNVAIEQYNNGDMGEFLRYVEKFKKE